MSSLYVNGLTAGETGAHFAQIYGASVSKETVSRITDRVIEEMDIWFARPLDEVVAAIFSYMIVVTIRDGQVANRPIYTANGVALAGEIHVLGLRPLGWRCEGAKFWVSVLAHRYQEPRRARHVSPRLRRTHKGLPDLVVNVWPLATVQAGIIHLIRDTFRMASKKDWGALKRDVRPIYTAPNPNAARADPEDLDTKWGKHYGAIIRLWESAWEELIPYLDDDVEIRRVICSTNATEALSARYR